METSPSFAPSTAARRALPPRGLVTSLQLRIATIGVLPEYRRRGIASAMLKEIESRLEARRIRLSVRASNQTAVRLYIRFGYTRYGSWPRYYNEGEDVLVLEKVLGEN